MLTLMAPQSPHSYSTREVFPVMDVSNTELTDTTFSSLFQTNNTDTITCIRLDMNYLTSRSASFLSTILQMYQNVHTIALCNNDFQDEGIIILSKLLVTNKIKSWHMSQNQISDVGCSAMSLVLQQNSHLKILNLEKNDISNKGAHDLSNLLLMNKTLEYLLVSENEIEEEGLMALAKSLTKNETLLGISLKENYMTEKTDLLFIRCLDSNSTLHFMTLYDDEETSVQVDINDRIGWNLIGGIESWDEVQKLPILCVWKVECIIWLLEKVDIYKDLQWIILSMLQVRDIVESGNYWNIDTWR